MELFSKVIQIFNKPFPVEESRSVFYRNTVGISIFIFLFLFIFQPFGIHLLESNKFMICLGFGTVALVVSIVYEFVISGLVGLKRVPANFTFGKWILYLIGLILTISVANFLFARLVIFGYILWELLPHMMYGTFAIGVFPIMILGGLALLQQERKYLNIAEEINQAKVADSNTGQVNGASIFGVRISEIKYVEALQNYIKIGYVNTAGQLTEQTERATLKSFLDETKGSPIVKCHRSYLVNRDAIVATSGNAQGLLLTLSECDKTIPVSRSYVRVFRAT